MRKLSAVLAAAVAGLAFMAVPAVAQASARPVPHAIREVPGVANTTFEYITADYGHNECIEDNGLGAQATLTSTTSGNCAQFIEPRIGGAPDCIDGFGCYQYEDEAGFCLKLDPVAGLPVHFGTCTSSGVYKEEEEFTDPMIPSPGYVTSLYGYNHEGGADGNSGLGSTGSDGGVLVGNTPTANEWSI
jgi:hypothetical protein